MCGVVGVLVGGMLPQGNFEFLGYIRWYLRPFCMDHLRLILTLK